MKAEQSPWRRLRDLEPPLGARRRVLEAAEDALAGRPTRRRILWLSVPALAAAALLAVWLFGRDRERAVATAGSRSAEAGAERSPAAGVAGAPPAAPRERAQGASPERAATSAPIRIAADDHLSVDLAGATATVHGPARLTVGADRLAVTVGRVDVDGRAIVAAPMCEARVHGRAEVIVDVSRVNVTVFAGTAEVQPESSACSVVWDHRLQPPPADEPRPRRRPALPPAPESHREVAATSAEAAEPASDRLDAAPEESAAPVAATSSRLRRQVDAYRRARALLERDDRAALSALQAIVTEWPDSPLREEVDASIVEALERLGRHAEARTEARAFVKRHPRSPRTAEMRALAEDAP